ncbi:hypothetical protein [Chelativorans sp.]|uniref:hypothetical protein n=1 Tax=Chelativorans sp. TaxID=2203393 RepID=UPI0028109E26|nr:hypothetical protein [Chelativorans sp.]
MQAPPVRDDGLQLDERRHLQRAFWSVERFAWVVFALVLLLAIAGFTGSGGYFSKAEAAFPAGQIEYPRVARWEASDEVSVSFNGGADRHRLTFDHTFFEYFEAEGIHPEPERMTTGPDGVVMEFAAEEQAPVKVILYLRAMHPGLAQYRVGLDGSAAGASTLVLP